MSLLDDLKAGSAASAKAAGLGCSLCDYINQLGDDDTREALTLAAAGTMGTRSLADLLRRHNADVGRRTVERHRREDHTP